MMFPLSLDDTTLHRFGFARVTQDTRSTGENPRGISTSPRYEHFHVDVKIPGFLDSKLIWELTVRDSVAKNEGGWSHLALETAENGR